VTPTDVFDEPDRASDGGGRVVGQAEGQGQEEQHLGVGRSLHVWIQRRLHGHQEIALDRGELRERPVVHPQPPVVPERVTVAALYRRTARGAHMREQQWCADLGGDLAEVLVFQAGCVPLNTAGVVLLSLSYQPIPKPSPFVVNPLCSACRLWSMIECFGRKSRSSARIGSPE
jgi:hypothetical protein